MTEEEINDTISLNNSIVYKILFPPESEGDFLNFDEIKIDLDSVLSVVFTVDMDNWSPERKIEFLKTIVQNFVYFLEKYIENNHLSIYYNLTEYKIFTSIYPNWCKDRQKRYNNIEIKNSVQKYIINKLIKLSELKSSINVIKCEDSPIIQIMKDLDKTTKRNIIVSRDPHMLCLLTYYDIDIYNGRYFLNRETYTMEPDCPGVHYSLIPAYFLIRGIHRDEYKGIKGYGKKKTDDLINKNLIKTVRSQLPQMEEVNKYRKIFFLKELV